MKQNKVTGNQDEKEKSRQLTEAEQKRLKRFEELSESMVSQGYERTELTVSIVKANVFAVGLLVPLFVIGLGVFLLVHGTLAKGLSKGALLAVMAAFFALIVVHELIHGASWAVFTPHRWKDIEFGFMKQYMTPYCTCGVPLTKGQYIFGALMPLFTLGILPMVLGIVFGSLPVLLLGIIMADAAAGDIMIVWNILRYKTDAGTVVYMDHPTQAGGVIFTR